MQLRSLSKGNVHCLEHNSNNVVRTRQNSVFVDPTTSILESSDSPRRARSAFDIQSMALVECSQSNPTKEDNDDEAQSSTSRLLGEVARPAESYQRQSDECYFDKPSTSSTKPPLQRERELSICHHAERRPSAHRERLSSIYHFDRMDVLAVTRPLHRSRSRCSSICQFERDDFPQSSRVLALREARAAFYADALGLSSRGSRGSICERGDLFGRTLHRERRLSYCNINDKEDTAFGRLVDRRLSVSNFERTCQNETNVSDKTEHSARILMQHQKKNSLVPFYEKPSTSTGKTSDATRGYKATCV